MLKTSLVLVLLLVEIYADFDLNILPSGSSHSRSLNTSVLFSCEVDKTDDADSVIIKWVGPDNSDITERPINSVLNERKYVENDNGHVKKLYIKHIELGDAGNYTCVASVDGKQQNKSINFIVYKEIVFVSAASPQHPAIHTDALVVCKVDGLPKPEVSWRYKDRKLDSERYTKVEDGLLIKNITTEDDGIYQCSANVENDGRFDFKTIKVEVHVPPTMVEGPGTNEGVEDDEITVSCKGEGYPNPEYTFYKNGEFVKGDERVVVDGTLGEINFKPLKEEDAGTYTCKAHNDVGEALANGSLNVLVRPHVSDFANKSQNEGQPVSIECKARGNPPPSFEFTKEGREKPFELGDSSEEDARISVISNGEGVMRLTIKRLLPLDAGFYKCAATNDVGKGEATAYLNVTYKPRFPINHTKEAYIWAQKTRNISCEADAQPPATFHWSRDEDPVVENSTYKIFQMEKKSILQITVQEVDQFWIYGRLTCKADNGYGHAVMEIDFIRATVPDIPKSVEVHRYLPNGFILRVMPPLDDGGEPLVGYHVEYHEKSSADYNAALHNKTVEEDEDDEDEDAEEDHPSYQYNVAVVEQIDDHLLKIENLRPSTHYVLKVRAKNEVGVGEYVSLKEKTEDIRKPYPIKIKSKPVGGAYHYTLEWEKPETGGSPIREYEFKYRQKIIVEGQETHTDWTTLFRTDDKEHPFESFLLKNLQPNSTYQLQVRAKNDIDWAEYSPIMEFQTSEEAETEQALQVQSAMSGGTIVGLSLFLLFLIIVIIDLLCYVCFRKGITHTMVMRSRERSRAGEKEKVMEEGENKNVEPDDIQNDNPVSTEEDLLKSHDDDDIKKPPIIEETIEDELELKKEVA
uniref:LeechCAM n=1 Tax=Hirudo medicinalis TaxID=6421 RepID=O18466_HIRME|nr:leechCAM [Hirudo medicinalis]